MAFIEFFSNGFVRIVGLPLAAVLLTAIVKRHATRSGDKCPDFLSWKTFDVGLDICVLAVLTAFTTIASRAQVQVAVDSDMTEAEVATAGVATDALSQLHKRAAILMDLQVFSAVVLAVAIVACFILARYMSDHGYVHMPSKRGQKKPDPVLRPRAVAVTLFWGCLFLAFAMISSRDFA